MIIRCVNQGERLDLAVSLNTTAGLEVTVHSDSPACNGFGGRESA